MYEGFVAFEGKEIVNSHRAIAYAEAAGIHEVRLCTECETIDVAIDAQYKTPLLDTVKPPWWNASIPDSAYFLGVLGLEVENADNSMRALRVEQRAGVGANISSMTYTARTMTVRAVAIGATDCALGYGLEWLRSLDGEADCVLGSARMYECCPHIAQAECDDPTCVDTCVRARAREFRSARISSGPTVLRRQNFFARGAFAEIEFVITAADPYIYTVAPPGVPLILDSHEAEDDLASDVVAAPDGFALPTLGPVPPSFSRVSPFTPRTRWLRQAAEIAPTVGMASAPMVVLEANGDVPDVRVTLASDDGLRYVYRMSNFPVDGRLTLDFGSQTITTESNGHVGVNSGFVLDGEGGPVRWPRSLPPDTYSVFVDRAPSTEPFSVAVASAGVVGS